MHASTNTTPMSPVPVQPQPDRPPPDDRTRLYLALMIGIPFVILSLAAPFYPAALTVLKEIVVPLLALVVGYLFGQRVERSRS